MLTLLQNNKKKANKQTKKHANILSYDTFDK